MRKIIILIILCVSFHSYGQKYISDNGFIKFYSEELLEDITAINKNVQSVFDEYTGQIVFSVPINKFDFEKSLMQEHFNEKYMESNLYPKAIFRGKVSDYQKGQKNPKVWAEGDLEIHGVNQHIKVSGSLDYDESWIRIHSVFMVKLEDYEITIPELMFQKIAEEIEITIDLKYRPYEK